MTKKIYSGLYLHIATNKYISIWKGEQSTLWHIWNDIERCEEFAMSFLTKADAIEFLDYLINY